MAAVRDAAISLTPIITNCLLRIFLTVRTVIIMTLGTLLPMKQVSYYMLF